MEEKIMEESKAQANKRKIQGLERIALGESEVNKVEVEDEGDKKINDVPQENLTKICPFCAEEVKIEALKCKHCGEQLDDSTIGHDSNAEKDKSPILSLIWKVGMWIFVIYWVGVFIFSFVIPIETLL